MDGENLVAVPPVPVVSDVVTESLRRVEDAAERAREAAERSISEVATLADRLDRRLDDMGKAFVDHSHVPIVSDAAGQAVDIATEVPRDVVDTVAGSGEEVIAGEAPRAPESGQGKRRRNFYRLRG